ncbi:unnamed protein product [Ilex paraguariensis]|uniref:Uncharacterized protein n=1 Tax=Ilex paraguariensis TaxID=185542 RepID=A0ABC8U467_9AQUA
MKIDAEVSTLKKKLDGMRASGEPIGGVHETASTETTVSTIEALKEALAHIRVCSRLEGLLLKKKSLKNGDSLEIHAQKVDKLKVLSESLASSTTKAEKRISDHRFQKEEALKFRVSKTSEVGEIEKVDKLKVLSESLASSTTKAEKRISDHRFQKEEALKFRVSKTSEVGEIEKELAAEISGLEKQRDELEAQLKKVTSSLAAAQARLHNVREERDQFYEANDHIVAHLKTKEDELSRSIGSCKIEADVLNTWINFLEDTWVLQCSYTEIKEKEVNDELKRHEGYFLKLVIELLTAYEIELSPCIDRIGKYVENLKSLSEGSEKTSDANDEGSKVLNPRKNLEEEYLDYEAKFAKFPYFEVVFIMGPLPCPQLREKGNGGDGHTCNLLAHLQLFIILLQTVIIPLAMYIKFPESGMLGFSSSRKDDPRVKELFDNIEKLREEFESIERPNLEMETPPQEEHTPASKTPQESQPHPIMQATETPEAEKNEHPQSPTVRTERLLDPEAELAKLESEFGKVNREYSAEEIGEWEFDELEKELRSSDAATSK